MRPVTVNFKSGGRLPGHAILFGAFPDRRRNMNASNERRCLRLGNSYLASPEAGSMCTCVAETRAFGRGRRREERLKKSTGRSSNLLCSIVHARRPIGPSSGHSPLTANAELEHPSARSTVGKPYRPDPWFRHNFFTRI
jgi:hypothetical protein